MDGHRMMTVKELADYLHIATSTVYRMAEQGELPAL
jgi:excisionase family DNA binding protein